MTIDEVEKKAASILTEQWHGQDTVELAEFALAVMPVMRAAEAWRETEALDITFDQFARDHLNSIDRLKRAIDTMRREIRSAEEARVKP